MAANKNQNARILKDLTSMTADQLKAKILELEAQNEALASGHKPASVELQDYKGSPVLYFQGSFKPFHAGLGKLGAMLEMLPQVEAFVKSGGKKVS